MHIIYQFIRKLINNYNLRSIFNILPNMNSAMKSYDLDIIVNYIYIQTGIFYPKKRIQSFIDGDPIYNVICKYKIYDI